MKVSGRFTFDWKLALLRVGEQAVEVSLAIEEPEVATEQLGIQRSAVSRQEGLDVSLLSRPPGRGVDERLKLQPDERLRIGHRHP